MIFSHHHYLHNLCLSVKNSKKKKNTFIAEQCKDSGKYILNNKDLNERKIINILYAEKGEHP